MDLFSRIKALCDEYEVSPTKLGLELGFSKDTINSWKTKSPSADKLQKVADYFNVSTDYLLGRTDNPLLEPPTLVLTPDEQAAVEAFLAVYRAKKDS